MPRRRHSVWLFHFVTGLRAATMRLDTPKGAVERIHMMHELEDAYDDAGFCASQSSGVAALGPDSSVVAVYYAPNDPRNTSTNYAAYCLQHNIIEPERRLIVPRSANDVVSYDAYLPQAARERT